MTTLVGAAIAAYISSKLGGLTGDTYGALNELLGKCSFARSHHYHSNALGF